jgi:hypothetical protein
VLPHEQETWARISSGVGEALLDVERTFINLVDQHSTDDKSSGGPMHREYLLQYMDAWAVLDRAHLRFVQVLRNAHGSPPLTAVKCQRSP